MMTPGLGAIRETYPDAELVIVANPLVAQLFTHHPWCDRVIVYDRKGEHRGIGGFLRFAGQLRAESFDMAILLQKAFEAALLTRLAGIPRRIGFSTDARSLLLSNATSLTDEIKRLHHSRHYLHMLKSFGIEGQIQDLCLEVTTAEKEWAGELLGQGRWLAVNPGAAYGSAKRWYPERFARAADLLAEEFDLKVLLVGGPAEQQIGADIEEAMERENLNLIGKTSIREMMAVISCCALMITNDSGPMHVAAALKVPIVAIFGPTDHTTTYPWSDDYEIVRADVECAPCLERTCPTDHRCMLSVSSDDVAIAARRLIV